MCFHQKKTQREENRLREVEKERENNRALVMFQTTAEGKWEAHSSLNIRHHFNSLHAVNAKFSKHQSQTNKIEK